MILKKIYIKNFLSYSEEQEINLNQKSIIVGENGSGKSNLVRIIDFILSNSATSNLDWSYFPFWDTKTQSKIYLTFELSEDERIFLRKFLVLSFCSMHLSSDQEFGRALIYSFFNNWENFLKDSFSDLTIGFCSESNNPERLKYFLILSFNESLNIYLSNPSTNIIILVDKEKKLDEILTLSKNQYLDFRNITSFVKSFNDLYPGEDIKELVKNNEDFLKNIFFNIYLKKP